MFRLKGFFTARPDNADQYLNLAQLGGRLNTRSNGGYVTSYSPQRPHQKAGDTRMLSTALISLALFSLASPALGGATYALTSSTVGNAFYSNFNFEAIPDPTAGDV